MEKASDYISKKVISIENGCVVGYVLDIIYDDDFKKIEKFVIVDDESEKTFSIIYDDIKSKNNECLMIENNNLLQLYFSENFSNPIGKSVFNKEGLFLGNVEDVLFCGKLIKKIITNKCEIPVKFIFKVGKDCIIYGKRSKNTIRYDFKSKNNLPKVFIEQINNNNFYDLNKSKEIEKPIKLIANEKILIGREAKADIFGYNNEIIIKKYEKITQNVIYKAKIHNKLNLLFFYSE